MTSVFFSGVWYRRSYPYAPVRSSNLSWGKGYLVDKDLLTTVENVLPNAK